MISTSHILQLSQKQASTASAEKPKTYTNKSINQASTSAVANNFFFCKFCNVSSLSNYQHKLHINSKKHKDAITKFEVLKFEPKLEMSMSYKPAATLQSEPAAVERRPVLCASDNVSQPKRSMKPSESGASKEMFTPRCQPHKSYCIQPSTTNMPANNSRVPSFRGACGVPHLYGTLSNSTIAANTRTTDSNDARRANADECHDSSETDHSHGMDSLPVKKVKQEFNCTPCDKMYSSEDEYNSHLESKEDRGRMCMYQCDVCSATFSSKQDLSMHVASAPSPCLMSAE